MGNLYKEGNSNYGSASPNGGELKLCSLFSELSEDIGQIFVFLISKKTF